MVNFDTSSFSLVWEEWCNVLHNVFYVFDNSPTDVGIVGFSDQSRFTTQGIGEDDTLEDLDLST